MNISLNVILHIRHLNLIIDNIGSEIPKLRDFFLSLVQLVKLS